MIITLQNIVQFLIELVTGLLYTGLAVSVLWVLIVVSYSLYGGTEE